MTIRVVLGEDNVLVREGVRALLNSYDDIEVVGVAEDAPSLLATAAEHSPDVVVTDIKMPPSFQLEGIDCAHAIRDGHPDTGVVVLSAHDDEEYAIALARQGPQRPRVPAEGPDRAGRRARPRDPRGPAGRQRGRPGDRRAALGPRRDGGERPRGPRHDGAGPGLRADGGRARHHPGVRRPSRDRAVPPDGRRRGAAPACSTSSSGCMPPSWSRSARRPRWSFVPSQVADALGARRDADRASRSSRSPSCSATSAGSPRSPSGSRRATSPRSSGVTWARWPRSSWSTAARSTSSRATP